MWLQGQCLLCGIQIASLGQVLASSENDVFGGYCVVAKIQVGASRQLYVGGPSRSRVSPVFKSRPAVPVMLLARMAPAVVMF